jgi:D-3-phosphoglycerate dehydrogenase
VKVLVKENVGESGVELLRDAGFDVDLGYDWSADELAERIGDYDAILIRSGRAWWSPTRHSPTS